MATKLAGEVEGREKHDTSCLTGNMTTAPEGAEGLFSMYYPRPVKADLGKGSEGLSLGAKESAQSTTHGASVWSPFH